MFHIKHCIFYTLTLLRKGSLSDYTIYSFVMSPGRREHRSQPDLLNQKITLHNIHWSLKGHVNKVNFLHQITFDSGLTSTKNVQHQKKKNATNEQCHLGWMKWHWWVKQFNVFCLIFVFLY